MIKKNLKNNKTLIFLLLYSLQLFFVVDPLLRCLMKVYYSSYYLLAGSQRHRSGVFIINSEYILHLFLVFLLLTLNK